MFKHVKDLQANLVLSGLKEKYCLLPGKIAIQQNEIKTTWWMVQLQNCRTAELQNCRTAETQLMILYKLDDQECVLDLSQPQHDVKSGKSTKT